MRIIDEKSALVKNKDFECKCPCNSHRKCSVHDEKLQYRQIDKSLRRKRIRQSSKRFIIHELSIIH